MRAIFRRRTAEWIISLPSMSWLVVFFLAPSLIVLTLAFRPVSPFGGVGSGWTLETLRDLWNPAYVRMIWRTVWISSCTTFICLVLALPTGYYIARAAPSRRRLLLLLIIVPFWTSFLIRVFAWKVLLHPDGVVKQLLVWAHIVRPESVLLYSAPAVLLVMVYSFLPFAVLPIYAAVERFDLGLMEAARDLGAGPVRAFVKVLLPGIRRGVLTALLVVFIPALGAYVIPDLVGGPASEMIGNKIAQRVFVDRNLPHAGALSAVLMLALLMPLLLILAFRSGGSPVDARVTSSTGPDGRLNADNKLGEVS